MNVALEDAKQTFISLTVFRYGVVALYALQVYEWLLMLSEEIYLVHRGRWTSVKIAYLMCRYYPLVVWPLFVWAWVGDHAEELCTRIVHPLYCLMIPFQLSSQGVILIRSYAFTGRKKIVLAILCTSYAILLAAEIVAFTLHIQSASASLQQIIGDTGCLRKLHNGNFPSVTRTGVVYASALLMDIICTSTVLLHCVQIRSTQGKLGKTFLTHGLSAFVVMSCVNLIAAIQYFRPLRYGVGLPLVVVLNNIVACRLILHLRRRVFVTETQEERDQSRIVRDAIAALVERQGELDQWVYPSTPSPPRESTYV